MNQRVCLIACTLLLANFFFASVIGKASLLITVPIKTEPVELGSSSQSSFGSEASLVPQGDSSSDKRHTYTSSEDTDATTLSGGGLVFNITSKDGVFDGYNMFDLRGGVGNALFIMDLTGEVIKEKPSWTIAEFINSTHVLCFSTENDVVLWNIYTGSETYIDIYGHHELEYNPRNNTILTFGVYVVTINGTRYLFDMIEEYNMDGELVWSMDTRDFISPDQWCPFQDGASEADVTHSNSIFFDSEEDTFLYNARNVNTFYKIDHNTGQVLWGLGEYGNFTLYDCNGTPKNILFYHAHAVEQVDDNTFILFDNDFHNQTNPDNQRSRILEITINETTMTANESWSWVAPHSYYSRYFGDADRLPNGNRLAVFGTYNGPRLVEVSDEGEIVWEQKFPSGYGIYRAERVHFEPILSSPPDIHSITSKEVNVTWQVFYNFRPKRTMIGSFNLLLDEVEINSGPVSFDKLWRPSNLTFNLGVLADGRYNLSLVVTDEGGHTTIDSLNVTVGPFYIEREGPLSIEIGQDDPIIRWSGVTCSSLLYNITTNSSLYSYSSWNGGVIPLDLASLEGGKHLVLFRLYNESELIHSDSFWVTVYPPEAPVITPAQSCQAHVTWNETLDLSWHIFDNTPSSWSLFLDNKLAASKVWNSQTYLLNWTLPTLDEGPYNISLVAFDLTGQQTINTTWLTVNSPSPAAILFVSEQTEFLFGQENASLIWEVHGGQYWTLWRNGTQIRQGVVIGHEVRILIENYQAEYWRLGDYNLTLEVVDSFDASITDTQWIEITLIFGDAYANTVVAAHSQWYLFGENSVGAPDDTFSSIYLDYGNGYLTLDMGLGEEVLDGAGDDLQVIAQGGLYTVRVSDSLAAAFKTIGWGMGNLEFDLASSGFSSARYIRIEYRDGVTVDLDAIVASNYNHVEDDVENPLVLGPDDFWVFENQSTITFTWETYDDTPWNYSIDVDEALYKSGTWNGSDIVFTLDISATGTWAKHNVTLTLFDVCGHQSQDTVLVDILPIDTENPQITGPEDFWIWETQTSISLIWEAYDLTPWNYTVRINGALYYSGPWNGSEIILSFDLDGVGVLEVTLILYDFFLNHAEDTVHIEILPILIGLPARIFQLGFTMFVIGICLALTILLVLTLKKLRP